MFEAVVAGAAVAADVPAHAHRGALLSFRWRSVILLSRVERHKLLILVSGQLTPEGALYTKGAAVRWFPTGPRRLACAVVSQKSSSKETLPSTATW
ncbi:hypothetical protein GCM10009757_28820 [Streptomyces cheonanensis]|uniref:Secreted protein n=1 Tax=Streptomyces cheonanensis TaxID=312720 RepID=A0ABN2V6S5_9ACTN